MDEQHGEGARDGGSTKPDDGGAGSAATVSAEGSSKDALTVTTTSGDTSKAGPSPEPAGSLAVSPAATEAEFIAKLQARIADLTGQVTSLNGKLVQSFNRVGGLEDEVERSKQDSASLNAKIEKLEAQRKEWEDKYEGGLLVEKDHVQAELSRMMDRVIEETAERGKAENDKATIERELAELSSQLFTEANNMVAQERIGRLRAERKMDDLDRNLKDTETLLHSQQEQMRNLGGLLEEIEKERDELKKDLEEMQHNANTSSISVADSDISAISDMVPSTPGTITRQLQNFAISHPLQFLSFDIPPYVEFVIFTKTMARIRRSILSRPLHADLSNIGGYAGAYGGAYTTSTTTHAHSQAYLEKMHQLELKEHLRQSLPLSQYLQFPFMKRINEEDSDPTLKLNDAPGLSFFTKRSMSSAIVDGTVVVEPAFTTIPSDSCALCGTSLQRFIAGHQTTATKEDPRKKFTRLATGWLPGSSSGTATPTNAKEKSEGWSLSGLGDALSGALTPNKEHSGFSFGNYLGSSTGSSSGSARPKSSSGVATPKERSQTLPAEGSEPSQGNFPLIPSARTHAVIYVFRAQDSDTKYAVCPTFCYPKLRAVCELWNYIRTIQKGLLMEDAPKFSARAETADSSEYSRNLRKYSASMAQATTFGGIRAASIATPAITPGMNIEKQLGFNFLPPPTTEAAPANADASSGLGLDIEQKTFNFDATKNPSVESLSSNKTAAPPATASAGDDAGDAPAPAADAQPAPEPAPVITTDYAKSESAEKEQKEGDESKEAKDENETLAEPVVTSRRSSVEGGASEGENGEAKASAAPARPKRSAARGATPGSAPMTPAASEDAVPVTVTQASPETPQSGTLSAPINRPPVNKSPPPPALPARSGLGGPMSPAAMQKPRLPNRPSLGKLTMPPSFTKETAGNLSRSVSRRTSPERVTINTQTADWQRRCWHEIVRLREAAFWARVGSAYNHQQ